MRMRDFPIVFCGEAILLSDVGIFYPLIHIQSYSQYSCIKEYSLGMLNSQELERYESYNYFHDKIKFLQRHYYIRKILKDIRMPDLVLEYDNLGKPILKKNDHQKLAISISSSEDFFAIALFDKSIGIDIQKEYPIDLSSCLTSTVLNAQELTIYNQYQNKKQHLRYFYEIWSKKEAYTKALGKGLLLDFSTIDTTNIFQTYCLNYMFFPTSSYHVAWSIIWK